MNRFLPLASLGLALSSTLLCVSCSSGSPGSSTGPTYVLCSTDSSQPVVRLSGVFPLKSPNDPGEPWAIDFRRYLAQSGNEGGVTVTCTQVSSQSALKDKADALTKQGKRVIQTGWTYAN